MTLVTMKANRMTPKEALDLLDRVSAVVTGDRETHDKIREAVRVLGVVVSMVFIPKKDD